MLGFVFFSLPETTEAVSYIWKVFLKNNVFRIRELTAAGLVYFPIQISEWEPAAPVLLLARMPAWADGCEVTILEMVQVKNRGCDPHISFCCWVPSYSSSTIFKHCCIWILFIYLFILRKTQNRIKEGILAYSIHGAFLTSCHLN